MKNSKNIVIIPARIGSKRIKEKNIKIFHKKPIIYWTIKSLNQTKLFDKIFVSTDSNKIVKVLKKFNFENIILRNKSLSNDKIGTNAVVIDAIKKIKKRINLENVWCFYPCNPFIVKSELKEALYKIEKNLNSLVFPVVQYNHPIERAYEIKKNILKRLYKQKKNDNTQNYKEKYFDSGKFYLAKKDTWLKNKFKNKIGVSSKWWNGVDIDTNEDWKRAELVFKIFKKSKKF